MSFTGKDLIELQGQIPVQRYANNDAYYIGDNTKILNAPSKRKPDNRVPIAFANRLVKNVVGYAARKGDIGYKYEADNVDNSFITAMNKLTDTSQLDLLNSRLYKTTVKQGVAYDLVWTEPSEDELLLKVADIPVAQGLPIFKDELAIVKELDSFIRYYDKMMEDVIIVNGEEVTFESGLYAQVFYPGYYEIWRLGKYDDTGHFSTENPMLKASYEQPFSKVQVTPYQANDESIPYWQPVKRIIDEFDKVMSHGMNENDRFNDTWIMFMSKLSPEVKKKIDSMGVVDNIQSAMREGISDAWPRFLERNVPTEHSKLMLDKLEDTLWTLNGSPDFLDQSIGEASGIALLFKLIGLEYSAIETDTYFDLGLNNRAFLISEALISGGKFDGIDPVMEADVENTTITVTHKRNIPMDVRAIVEDALKLKALGISNETILNYLPNQIVTDVEAELEKMEKQKEESVKFMQDNFTPDQEDPAEE